MMDAKRRLDALQRSYDELNAAFLRTQAELDRLHTWDGLMSLVDEHYPADIFPSLPDGTPRDPGPRIVMLLRELEASRAELDRVTAERDEAIERAELLKVQADGVMVLDDKEGDRDA